MLQIPYEKLQERTIVLHVMDKDKFTKDDKIGEIQIPLRGLDLIRKNSVWRAIGPVSNITMSKSPSKSPAKSPSKSRDSSSDDEKRSSRKSTSSGASMVKYRIRYEHSSRNLVVGVLEGRVCTQRNRKNILKIYIFISESEKL